MSITRRTYNRIHDEGAQDFECGISFNNNPYDDQYESEKAEAWNEGWLEAKNSETQDLYADEWD